jgi:hypothetical protein
LLSLAPFEKVCASVAQYAVRERLTATSLETTLLPNAKVLKGLGTLVELDFKTKFDWQSECGKCPFKAYVRSGYSSYCLLPEEWTKKQEAALSRQRDAEHEAARVLEEARKENNGMVEAEHLTPGSYKDLSFGEPPAGCSPNCPCYRETLDPHDPTRKRPVCLDPARYRGLVQAEREAEEQRRRNHFNALWKAARTKLTVDVESKDLRRIVIFIALPILRSMYDEHGYIESWRAGVEEIAHELEVSVLDDFLNADTESEAYTALDQATQEGLEPEKILLLCACLMLADEARAAIRFIRETPGLDYILENKQTALEPDESKEPEQTGDETFDEGASSEEALAEDVDAPLPTVESEMLANEKTESETVPAETA